jgi:hypothetical protein
MNAPILQNYRGASMSSCNAMPRLALPVLRMGFAPGAHTLQLIRPTPVIPVFQFGVPVFLAQRFAGFFTGGCRTKEMAMATPGIGNEYLFAANAPALKQKLKKRHTRRILSETGMLMKIDTLQQVQHFKAMNRRELVRRRWGNTQKATFTLAVANRIKRQPLDVSRVVILDHEINPHA